jgi:hypothetical protein
MPESPDTKQMHTMYASQSQFFGAGLVSEEKQSRYQSVLEYGTALSDLKSKESNIDIARKKRQMDIASRKIMAQT